MIKKILLTYWFKKQNSQATYEMLLEDKISLNHLTNRYNTFMIRGVFLLTFLFSTIYMLFIKTELYESHSAIIVKDMSSTMPSSDIGLSILGVGSSSQLQDSMVVQEYLNSLDMFLLLNSQFQLQKDFKSSSVDFLERVSENTKMEDVLEFYRSRLLIYYDETSAILHISYAHTDPKKAQSIVFFMIQRVEDALNEFNRKKAKRELDFISNELLKNRKNMEEAAYTLEKYQNENLLLDPKSEALSSTSIIGGLEATLTQKQIEFKTKSSYLNSNNYELTALKSEIKETRKALSLAKANLSGKGKNKLNRILFEFQKLKMQLEFDTQVYKTTLIEYETTKIETLKAAKMLSILTQPNLPDGYTYPNKPKAMITLFIAMFLFYGIFSMLLAIIKDHKE